MNLRQLELLRAVIRFETTVRAAQHLGLSQPAVSNAIKHMESQLGFALFERVNNRLFITPEAKMIYDESEHLFQMYEAFGERIKDLKNNRLGTIRILASPPLGHSVIPAALCRFQARRGGATAHFDIRGFSMILDCIEAGSSELGFVIGTGNIRDLETEVFFSEALVCVMPPDHPLAKLEVIHPHDLSAHSVIGLQPSTGMGQLIRSIFEEAEVPYRHTIEVRYCNTACVLVQNGAGVAVVDALSAMTSVGDRLVIRPMVPERRVTASAVWSSRRPLSRSAQLFLRDVRTVARDLQVGALPVSFLASRGYAGRSALAN